MGHLEIYGPMAVKSFIKHITLLLNGFKLNYYHFYDLLCALNSVEVHPLIITHIIYNIFEYSNFVVVVAVPESSLVRGPSTTLVRSSTPV